MKLLEALKRVGMKYHKKALSGQPCAKEVDCETTTPRDDESDNETRGFS